MGSSLSLQKVGYPQTHGPLVVTLSTITHELFDGGVVCMGGFVNEEPRRAVLTVKRCTGLEP